MEKRRPGYAALGIPEYWRFDQTGDFHETWLAGDRLVEDRYEPIPIETVEEGVLQGYSSVLNLLIRWDHGELGWHDPETGHHIATFHQERLRGGADRIRRNRHRHTDLDDLHGPRGSSLRDHPPTTWLHHHPDQRRGHDGTGLARQRRHIVYRQHRRIRNRIHLTNQLPQRHRSRPGRRGRGHDLNQTG